MSSGALGQDPPDSAASAAPTVEEPVVASAEETWRALAADPVLSRPPLSGTSGDVPTGGDLKLDIGWERLEQLMVFVAQGILGLDQLRFRRTA